MSLNRLALRLAAIAALTNNGKAPWPTLAEYRVFDSRLDPVEKIVGEDGPYPLLTVYTDRSFNLWPAQIGGDKHPAVHLFIETSVAIREAKDGGDGYDIGVPFTDSELETTLDVLACQVRRALFGDAIFAGLAKRVVSVEEIRAATSDGQRLAVYFTDMQFEVMPDRDYRRVPDHIAPLIDLLADNPAYADRAIILRDLCTDPASVSQADLRRLNQFWPGSTDRALGYPE